jgi:phosphoserine phosphatase
MNSEEQKNLRYTGLILLTGVDSAGIFSTLFSTLEPFSITILDIEQIVVRSRLILTVLIELDPAHAEVIEEDLNKCAEKLNVDIATSFGTQTSESIANKDGLIHVSVTAQKISPGTFSTISATIVKLGGNIERIYRSTSNPQTTLEFLVSGTDIQSLKNAISSATEESDVHIAIKNNTSD